MQSIKNYFKKIDFYVTAIVLVLTVIHLLTVFSTTFDALSFEARYGRFMPQLFFSFVGISLFFWISNYSYDWINNKLVAMLSTIVVSFLLIYVLTIPTIAGVHRWINILGIPIQPSELGKIVLLFLGSQINIYKYGLKNIYILLIALFIIFLVFIEPSASFAIILFIAFFISITFAYFKFSDIVKYASLVILGVIISCSAIFIHNAYILLAIILIAIFYYAKKPKLTIWLITGIVIFFAPFLVWNSAIIKDYQKERFINFLSFEQSKSSDYYYQQYKARSQISMGGILGKGYLNGTKKIGDAVPYMFTDFAISSYIEEFGGIGLLIFHLVITTLIIRIILIGRKSRNSKLIFTAYFISSIIYLNYLLSLLINMGYMVNTGVPAPFLSYGGSSTITLYILLGLYSSMYKQLKNNPSVEYKQRRNNFTSILY